VRWDRDDPPPPVVCALIDQSALNREIGGQVAMRDQLVHLVAMSRRPNITVQVIPNTGAHPGLLGAFTVADLGGSPGILNIEDITEGRVSEDAATGRVLVRDSKDPDGGRLGFSARAWCEFAARIKGGHAG